VTIAAAMHRSAADLVVFERAGALVVRPVWVGTERYFQALFRDPRDAFLVGMTGGLHVDFCP